MTCGVLLLIATTLRNGPCVEATGPVLGNLIHAKSRVGSQISVMPLGRYPPTVDANEVPTFCEVRRIIPISVPLCFLSPSFDGSGLTPGSGEPSSPRLNLRALGLGDCTGEDGEPSRGDDGGASLKI